MSVGDDAFSVQAGSVTVRCYPSPNNGYSSWLVCWHLAGRRLRRRAKNRAAAEIMAKEVADGLSTLSVDAGSIPLAQRVALIRAKELLPAGADLASIIEEYAAAKAVVPFASLVDAAQCYLRHHPTLPNLTLKEAVAFFLRAREGHVGARWEYDLGNRLNRFARDLDRPIHDLSRQDLTDWLNGLGGSVQTRRNYRSVLSAFFTWAKGRLVADDWNLLDGVTISGRRPQRPIRLFTPDEMEAILGAVPKVLLAYVAMAGFAGLRQAELMRLTWDKVDRKRKFIMLDSEVTKTQKRRLVPIQPNLLRFLQRKPNKGPVVTVRDVNHMLTKAALSARVEWRDNALRHSFISYRMSILKNVHEVALEAGNSDDTIFTHYRELVTPADAKRWFNIRPRSSARG